MYYVQKASRVNSMLRALAFKKQPPQETMALRPPVWLEMCCGARVGQPNLAAYFLSRAVQDPFTAFSRKEKRRRL
jgi:hypothetical protein